MNKPLYPVIIKNMLLSFGFEYDNNIFKQSKHWDVPLQEVAKQELIDESKMFIEKSVNDYNNYINNFHKREYDLIFVAYDIGRRLKNYHLLLTLLKSNELDHLNILIVGINDNVEKVNKPNIKYVGYTNNDKLKLLLSNCKALICPSLYDSNPNVVCEALINDCNVIASTNCGNLHYLNEELIVDSSFWSPQTWLEKIKLAVSYKYFNKIIDKKSNFK